MDAEVAEAGPEVGKALAISLGVRHQNELIYQMGHEDAQRHGEAEGTARQQTQSGAVGKAGGNGQRQLIHQHQKVAEIGVKAEHPGTDVSRLQQGGVDQQTHRTQQENTPRRQSQYHHSASSKPRSRAISAA